jgi:peptide/nickel transport system substrate-binding protein
MLRGRLVATVAVALLLTVTIPPSFGQTLRIAMTASDTPTTTGIPNNGGEGFRFCGFPAFDGLIDWDFTHPERIASLTPGLASEWKIDDNDHTRWIFTLRDGVKFHDGTDVTVDALLWNLQRFFDDKSPQFDAAASAIVRSFVNMVDRWQKIDERHLAIYTKAPFSFFPYMVPTMLIVSPAQWEKTGRNWAKFGKSPAGTGPFKITKVVPGQSVEMTRNEGYWDKRQESHPEIGQDGVDPDAGTDDPVGGLARRPGRLDRGAAARRDSIFEGSRLPDQPVALSARLAVYPECQRNLGVPRQAVAPGLELRD